LKERRRKGTPGTAAEQARYQQNQKPRRKSGLLIRNVGIGINLPAPLQLLTQLAGECGADISQPFRAETLGITGGVNSINREESQQRLSTEPKRPVN
jgi:hypothetical protein